MHIIRNDSPEYSEILNRLAFCFVAQQEATTTTARGCSLIIDLHTTVLDGGCIPCELERRESEHLDTLGIPEGPMKRALPSTDDLLNEFLTPNLASQMWLAYMVFRELSRYDQGVSKTTLLFDAGYSTGSQWRESNYIALLIDAGLIFEGVDKKLRLSSTGSIAFAVLSEKLGEPVTDTEIGLISAGALGGHLLKVLQLITAETDTSENIDRERLYARSLHDFGMPKFIVGKVLKRMRYFGLIESVAAGGGVSLTQRGRDAVSKLAHNLG